MKKPTYLAPAKNEILWSGHLYDYSGYAKSNREVMFRLAKSVKIQATSQNLTKEAKTVDKDMIAAIDSFFKKDVAHNAALLRFYVPLHEKGYRYKICYTMMETQRIHPDFVHRLNNYYNEVWTPTEWNKTAFRHSGVLTPMYVVPLGVDPLVYNPGSQGSLPKCELLSTKDANKLEVPRGFNFISIFQPTFRKGLHVLLRAFNEAFKGDPDVNLIIGCTGHGFNSGYRGYVKEYCPSSKVYLMSGSYSEREMADIYRSSHAYVSTSLGEGCNLPAIEAGACGIPCILPKHTGHLQYADDTCAYMVPYDEEGPIYGAGAVCIWYAGMPFALMNEKATSAVAKTMLEVRQNYRVAMEKANRFSERLRSAYSWNETASKALDRLKVIWK